ncbi:MAG: NAD(P)-dependent oxidoreductase [Alphaproteobacteria bacterium]|nr:NAD(P)-dependent oxidoreductase [Alphaproteobacteria bacterium]
MALLITGGTGFVMSNLALAWLAADPSARVLIADVGAPDRLFDRYLAPVRDRITLLQADVTDPGWWRDTKELKRATHLVHGAAITPGVGATEKAKAREVVAVNVTGTLNALEWAKDRGDLARVIHVSTGSVYDDDGPETPLPEDGFEKREPFGLYAITKRAAELLARRYTELFGLPLVTVRLASVYGPMDRETGVRAIRALPNKLLHKALAGETIRISTLDAVGDYIHAGDVATALMALLQADRPRFSRYNISYGAFTTAREVLAHVAAAVPGTRWEVVGKGADIEVDDTRKRGQWGAYDNTRMRALGWRPRPLAEAIADYAQWIRTYEA